MRPGRVLGTSRVEEVMVCSRRFAAWVVAALVVVLAVVVLYLIASRTVVAPGPLLP